MKTYYTCMKKKRAIDKLLHDNAAYQAQNNCVTNSKTKVKEITRYCNKQFVAPIKQIDPEFYKSIKAQSE